MTVPKGFEVAIIGGGIAGWALGIALHKRNINVKIYERSSKFRELGAGVLFLPNGLQAMQICDWAVYDAFLKASGVNLDSHRVWESEERKVAFTWVYEDLGEGANFSAKTALGQNGVHRGRFLDELVKCFPQDQVYLSKELDELEEKETGKILMSFKDGSTCEADAVIGCDGIHSLVRKFLVGEDSPAANPTYTHHYVYRGLVPMDKAVEAIGRDKASSTLIYCNKHAHLITYAISGGKTLNYVAYVHDKNDWPDYQKLTRISPASEMLRDLKEVGPTVDKLMALVDPDEQLRVWAIFDLGNPVPTFARGRVAILGDAAHATMPALGSGTGFCMEDAACLAELLGDTRVQAAAELPTVLSTYNGARRERGQWLVRASRQSAKISGREAGDDLTKIGLFAQDLIDKAAGLDVEDMCNVARENLAQRLTKV